MDHGLRTRRENADGRPMFETMGTFEGIQSEGWFQTFFVKKFEFFEKKKLKPVKGKRNKICKKSLHEKRKSSKTERTYFGQY